MRRSSRGWLVSSALILSACGSTTGGSAVAGDAGAGASTDGATVPTTRLGEARQQLDAFECPAAAPALAEGMNAAFPAGGRTRGFHLSLPKNAGEKPVGVVFAWHGVGDNVTNFRRYFGPNPDGRADFPFAVVTPMCVGCTETGNSPGLLPMSDPKGITWDIFNSTPGDRNLEAALFEGVLGCLRRRATIDVAHVHSVGFSGGAIVSDLLHARYPKLVHSVVQLSGAWFNDTATTDAVHQNLAAAAQAAAGFGVDLSGIALAWNAFAPSTRGAVLATHGGARDQYSVAGFLAIDFEKSFGFAKPFLVGNGRSVVDCPHTSGHTPPSFVRETEIVDFLEQNPLTDAATAPAVRPASLASRCTID